MQPKIEKLSQDDLKKKGILSWPIWTKEVSRFDWSYDEPEQCYFLEGKVTLENEQGEKFSFGQGDFITFPKGMKCVWNVEKPVKKHYKFG